MSDQPDIKIEVATLTVNVEVPGFPPSLTAVELWITVNSRVIWHEHPDIKPAEIDEWMHTRGYVLEEEKELGDTRSKIYSLAPEIWQMQK